MASAFEDRQPQDQAVAVREPLVDIPMDPAPPEKPKVQLKLGRNRPSDAPKPLDVRPDEPKPQRRRLSGMAENDCPESAPEPEPKPESRPVAGRPRATIHLKARTGQAESPEAAGPSRTEGGMPAPAQPNAAARAIDPARVDQWIAELRGKQSLLLALVGGSLAALTGAALWAAITVITNAQIGWMAVGAAAMIGAAIRTLGRGLDKSFGWLGAGLALFTCILGNYLASCVFIAREAELPVISVLAQIRLAAIPGLMLATFHPLDIVFYGLAVSMGYRLAFRRISDAQIRQALAKV
ncbi:MAG: hypothetical protein ACM3VT_15205 [Solirubrobacterales bacterium]